MADVLVPLIVFMTPVLLYFTRHYFRLRERQLELQAQGGKLLAAPSAAESNRLKELEERVQNLESIVMKLGSSVSNGWLAERLQMGQTASVSQYVRRFRLARGTETRSFKAALSTVTS